MLKRVSVALMLGLIFLSLFVFTFDMQPVKSSGTIYIRADGSIDPPTAPISTVDNLTYTFTNNIYDSVVVERDNIVIDGASYILQAIQNIGIDLAHRKNVTIRSLEIRAFSHGIRLYLSSNNSIIGNIIADTKSSAIYVSESSNTILKSNAMINNKYSLYFRGEDLSHFIHDVDVSNIVDGRPVYYWINQSDRVVPFDAGYIAIVNSTRVTAQNLSLTKNGHGILLVDTTDSTIAQNRITSNLCGIFLYSSFNNTIIENDLIANNNDNVWLRYSSHNTISGNNITGSVGGGIDVTESTNNIVSGNNIENNWEGIEIRESSNNIVYGNSIRNNHVGINLNGVPLYHASNNNISRNNIINNEIGIFFQDYSDNNRFYHNNFIDNLYQLHVFVPEMNIWDDGYPSGGNFWSDYSGSDFFKGCYQNVTGSDWIGDTSYFIDESNQDSYPLMKLFAQVTISNMNSSKTGCLPIPTVGIGNTVNVRVTIENQGYLLESFNVSLLANVTLIEQREIALDSNSTIEISFAWNTTDFTYGNYTITVLADTFPEEADTSDNTLIGDTILVTISGDINGDANVNIKDAVLLGVAFGSQRGDVNYNPNADINGDDYVNIKDAVILGVHFGES